MSTATYYITEHPGNKESNVVKFASDHFERFLGGVQTQLSFKEDRLEDFLVTMPKVGVAAWQAFNELLRQNNVKIVIVENSDPKAVDYIVHALGGAVIGAGGGLAGSVAFLYAAAKYSLFVPGVGKVVTIGCLLGAGVGTIAGLGLVRMGLVIRFSPINPEMVDIKFQKHS